MVDLKDMKINRLIFHYIKRRTHAQKHSQVDTNSELVELNDGVIEVIKQRIIDSSGKRSRAFELDIEDVLSDSFFDLAKDLHLKDDSDFIYKSVEMAEKLGECQTRVNIPPSFLLIMECREHTENKPFIVVMKAEPHEALRVSSENKIDVLRKVFLSPQQKLYKIGSIYLKEKDADVSDPDNFGAFLFDDQFRTGTKPAEYFYKDFLGFSAGNNTKIQSKKFYDLSVEFITKHVKDEELRRDLLISLKQEFKVNTRTTISPKDFADENLPTGGDLKAKFDNIVCEEMPHSFVKDTTLIETKLNNRTIKFPSNVVIKGPEESFDSNVSIIEDQESLEDFSFDDHRYTIIKVKGRPDHG